LKSKYEALPSGHIYSHKTKRILKASSNGRGYQHVVLHIGKKPIDVYVHRYLAESLIPNPKGLREVNHKDGNKANNHIDNLEWVSSSDNKWHALKTGLRKYNRIRQLTIDGDILKEYDNTIEASKHSGASRKGITGVAGGKRGTSGGYKWEYI